MPAKRPSTSREAFLGIGNSLARGRKAFRTLAKSFPMRREAFRALGKWLARGRKLFRGL